MAFSSMTTVGCVFFCLVLGLLLSAQETGSSFVARTCCTGYTRDPIPFYRITGFKVQTLLENCNIEAIIFYTVKKNKICASQNDEWVRRTLNLLSVRLKKMSKTHSAVGKKFKKNKNNHLTTSARGMILSTTQSSNNVTGDFTYV